MAADKPKNKELKTGKLEKEIQQQERKPMDLEITYPHLNKKALRTGKFKRITNWSLLGSAAVTGIVNLCVGGKPWCFIVIVSIWVFWLNFLSKPLIENTVIGRLSQLLTSVSILLIVIDLIYGNGFYPFVVPIVVFSFLIALAAIFFFGFKKQKRNVMPMIWVSLSALLITGVSALGAYPFSWPIIVLGSLGLAFFLFCIICFREPLQRELSKRFHVK